MRTAKSSKPAKEAPIFHPKKTSHWKAKTIVYSIGLALVFLWLNKNNSQATLQEKIQKLIQQKQQLALPPNAYLTNKHPQKQQQELALSKRIARYYEALADQELVFLKNTVNIPTTQAIQKILNALRYYEQANLSVQDFSSQVYTIDPKNPHLGLSLNETHSPLAKKLVQDPKFRQRYFQTRVSAQRHHKKALVYQQLGVFERRNGSDSKAIQRIVQESQKEFFITLKLKYHQKTQVQHELGALLLHQYERFQANVWHIIEAKKYLERSLKSKKNLALFHLARCYYFLSQLKGLDLQTLQQHTSQTQRHYLEQASQIYEHTLMAELGTDSREYQIAYANYQQIQQELKHRR